MKNVEVKDGDGLGAVYDGICLGVYIPRDGLGGV